MDKGHKYWESSHSSNSKRNLKRKIVSRIKAMNTNIKRDNLWQGRFHIECNDIFYFTYSDGSGSYAIVFVTIYDEKTKMSERRRFEDLDFTMFHGYNFWEWVNKFVCDCHMEDVR